MVDSWSLSDWLQGLERWGQLVMVRAAVAAARRVLKTLPRYEREPYICPMGGDRVNEESPSALLAIEAAEAWRDCPCEEHQEVWRLANIEAMRATDTALWLPRATQRSHDVEAIQSAAQLTSEDTIRAAICKTLIEWAL